MARKPTMHDVAQLAGVGTMTVSRVLNQPEVVTGETAKKVRRAMARLRYMPDEAARSLRSTRSRTLGLIVPNLDSLFYATCAHGVSVVAKEHGYTVLLATSGDDAGVERAEALKMLQRRVEGLVIIPVLRGGSRLTGKEFAQMPVVAMDRPLAGTSVDRVVVENRAGAWAAVRHLVKDHGHQRVMFAGYGREIYTMQERFTGYRGAMKEAGLRSLASFACQSQEGMLGALEEAIRGPEPPTALFCSNSVTTRFALRAALALGLQIPKDLALVGFDDLELAETMRPAISAVRQPVLKLGESAAQLLFRRLGSAAPDKERGRETRLDLELLLRHSCGCSYEKEAAQAVPVSQMPVAESGKGRVPAAIQAPRPAVGRLTVVTAS